MKIRGKRVLRNGAIAGYVLQKNGLWRWRIVGNVKSRKGGSAPIEVPGQNPNMNNNGNNHHNNNNNGNNHGNNQHEPVNANQILINTLHGLDEGVVYDMLPGAPPSRGYVIREGGDVLRIIVMDWGEGPYIHMLRRIPINSATIDTVQIDNDPPRVNGQEGQAILVLLNEYEPNSDNENNLGNQAGGRSKFSKKSVKKNRKKGKSSNKKNKRKR